MSRRPPDTPFKQQKMPAWQPILTPIKVIAIFAIVGVIFVPVGVSLLATSNKIYERTLKYDGTNTDVPGCAINKENEGKPCSVS